MPGPLDIVGPLNMTYPPNGSPGGGTAAWGGLTGTITDQADLQAALTAKADKASPAFTGTPTAPTAAPGTNTTQLSTTAFVAAAIAAIVNSSPAALDTLNELATALGNDANFATTVTNALATKASLTGTETLTNKRVTARVQTIADAATITPNFDTADRGKVAELSQATLIANPSGTPTPMQTYLLRIKTTSARALTYGTQYRAIGVTLPTTTVAGKWLYLGLIWNSDDTKVDVIAVGQEA